MTDSGHAPDGRPGDALRVFHVEVARLPERSDLVDALREAGFRARPSGEAGVDVVCEDCTALIHGLDGWIAEHDLPLVPVRSGDTILLHPPAD